MKKRTEADYEEFKKWVRHYLDIWKLPQWVVYFEFRDIGTTNAQVIYKSTVQVASFTLNTRVDTMDTDRGIQQLAKHEVAHVLIGSLDALVADYCTEDEHKKALEDLIIRLETLLPD